MLLLLALVPLAAARPQHFQNFPAQSDIDFTEDAIYLAPSDRAVRQVEFAPEVVLPQLEDDYFYDEAPVEAVRPERDGLGGHRHGGNHRSGRQGRRQQQVAQNFDVPAPAQENRGGRQTGGTAPAFGVLNNPPNENGDYNFNFTDDDGSRREESGFGSVKEGSYSFTSPEGEVFSVSYTADETGYHPSGLPPMPAHVQRLLDHLAKVNGA